MKRTDLVLIRARGRDDGFKAVSFALLDITSYLQKHGFKIKVIDRHKDRTPISATLKEISSYNPRYVGISAMTSQAKDALKLGRLLKRRLNTPLIYGGLHFTTLAEEGLDCADIVVRGEGENALLDILKGNVNGRKTYTAEAISDLDSIPLPKEELLRSLNWNSKFFSLLTSRGCPFNCLFCLDKRYRDQGLRFHSVQYTLDLIELVKKTLGIQEFCILDDIFTSNQQRVFAFCKEIEKRGLKITLHCQTHSGIKNIQMYKAMRAAGFKRITIGIESGNDSVLRALNKRQTVAEVKQTIDILQKAGLEPCVLFMIGNITETQETVRDTINLARELSLPGWVSYAQPFPGSRFYEVARDYGRLINKDTTTYYNDGISFIPRGLRRSQMKRLHRELIKILIPPRPLIKRISNRLERFIHNGSI
jgi:radical SAM superfamily enzyme YgiQ (UPF0313 family)